MNNATTEVRDEIEVVRKAWRLTPPETDYRDPKWLKSAASVAAKAGRLPKRCAYGSVINQLHGAGYHRMIDHVGIIKVDGERHVIFEPYESRCSMDTARRMANELAEKLQCRAWVSLCSWHVPGATIRITLAPLHDVAPVVANPPIVNQTHSQPANASGANSGPHGASARVALKSQVATRPKAPNGWVLPGKVPLLGRSERPRY